LLSLDEIKEKCVLDVGSGSGRISLMLLLAKVNYLIAIEPSEAFSVLEKNLASFTKSTPSRCTLLKCAGDEIPEFIETDYAFSIGVLHHIPDPDPVIKCIFNRLKNGGKFIIWVYGKENNGCYLFLIEFIRKFTIRLPHFFLAGIVWILYWLMLGYGYLCRWISLPLKDYIINVFFKMSPDKRRLVIYDQLNPAYAKYYTRHEAENLLIRNGFQKVQIFHRHGYSWTVVGEKPKL